MTQPATRELLPTIQRTAGQAFAPIQRQFNRLFDELTESWDNLTEFTMAPRMDVRDTKKALELSFELPGIAQDDVKIAVEDDILTVSGEKKAESDTTEGDYRVHERSYGSFSRSVLLPRSVDAARIKATMDKGVLKIVAPKNGAAEPTTIPIQAAN